MFIHTIIIIIGFLFKGSIIMFDARKTCNHYGYCCTDHGFKSVRNLQGVQLNELNFLNMAETIRMEPLIAFVQKSNAAISGK